VVVWQQAGHFQIKPNQILWVQHVESPVLRKVSILEAFALLHLASFRTKGGIHLHNTTPSQMHCLLKAQGWLK
jgi:hypothetical protein